MGNDRLLVWLLLSTSAENENDYKQFTIRDSENIEIAKWQNFQWITILISSAL